MPQSQDPPGTRRLRAYAELTSYLGDFADGRYGFLWVLGRPGLSKTESIKAALRGRPAHMVKGGQATPLQLYLDCYRHRGQPIVLDDAEHLLENKAGARLVSALGDTTPAKLLTYASTTPLLDDVPRSFTTTSPLCVLANGPPADEAIISRAVVLRFDPSSREIHAEAAKWFWDQEIHDWTGRNLCCLLPLDCRWYGRAYQDKAAGRDWRAILLRHHTRDRVSALVQSLEADPSCPTREDKARRFMEAMRGEQGASRATYFRVRRKLEEDQKLVLEQVGPIPLRRTRPPVAPSPLETGMAPGPAVLEPDDAPRDLSARQEFARPVQGGNGTVAPPPRPVLDDRMPWEGRDAHEDEDAAGE